MQVLNELGVVVEFARQCEQHGFKIVSIQSAYPDAIVEKDGASYRVEFEFRSSNFALHKHDPRFCDLIVCWEDDFPESILPVVTLSHSDWMRTDITALPADVVRELAYWRQRALMAENQLATAIRNKIQDEEVAPSVPTYPCPYCEYVASSRNGLSAHLRFCKSREPAA